MNPSAYGIGSLGDRRRLTTGVNLPAKTPIPAAAGHNPIWRLRSQVDHFQGAVQELFVNTRGASEERSPGRNRRVPWRRHHGADLSKGRFPSHLSRSQSLALLAMPWYRLAVTIGQLHMFNALYLILLVVVVIITRASMRRIVGALVGTFAAAAAGIAVIAVSERAGWWHFNIHWEPYYLFQLGISVALGSFVFLLTWRLARRFGGRGLAIALLIAAMLGPFRDSAYMAMFPEWGYYAPGIAPMLAISVAYVVIGVVGHGLMRVISGPATADPLARRLWKHA